MLVNLKQNSQVTIPKNIIDKLKLKTGDNLEITIENDEIFTSAKGDDYHSELFFVIFSQVSIVVLMTANYYQVQNVCFIFIGQQEKLFFNVEFVYSHTF